MKHLIFTLCFIIIVTSCSNNEETNDDSIRETENISPDLENLKKNFMPYFSGVWTLSEYMDDLAKTKSPLKSSDKLNQITVLVFSEKPNRNELPVSSSLNNHEGFSFNIIFSKGTNEKSLKTDIADFYYGTKDGFNEIEIQKNKFDTIINLCIYNSDKKLLKKIAFKKIRESQPDEYYSQGLDYYANKLLFEGTYSVTDSSQSVKNIKINADGNIVGFLPYKKYLVITDFGSRFENNLDNINLYRGERDYDNFLYKFNGDTINLYKPEYVDEEMTKYGYGDLIYKIIRKK